MNDPTAVREYPTPYAPRLNHATATLLAETYSPADVNPMNLPFAWNCGHDLALCAWFRDPTYYHYEGTMIIYRQTYGAFQDRNDHLRNAFDY